MRDMVNVRSGRTKSYEAPSINIGRSQFNLSHRLKMTFNASYLYPILSDEVVPGDTFTCSLEGFARIFSPLDAPVMDEIVFETFFFFIPNRLVWDNWQYFQGEHDEAGAQDTSYTIPVLGTGATVDHDTENLYSQNALMAYMGLPDGLATASVPGISALPFRGYSLVYNEFFRDQNLIDSVTVATHNGPDSSGSYPILKSGKKHDYFTSCLPYLQKGAATTVALTGEPRVGYDSTVGLNVTVYDQTAANWKQLDTTGALLHLDTTTGSNSEELFADLADGGALDINALRLALATQRALELDARSGTRYVEIIKSRFGVTSPDFRLQRPEFLGGGKSFINFHPIANTSEDATNKQGHLVGIGTGQIRGHGWSKSFTEHGHILGLIRARGNLTYFQGVPRMFSRSTRYDFYEPIFANLGEQAVLNKELFVSNSSATDDATFGYNERWAEYRFKPSRLVGNFNPDVSGALDHWHVAEDFASLPSLNQTFIEDQTPMNRIQTVTTEPDFLLDLWFDYKAARPIPVYSVPSILGARF